MSSSYPVLLTNDVLCFLLFVSLYVPDVVHCLTLKCFPVPWRVVGVTTVLSSPVRKPLGHYPIKVGTPPISLSDWTNNPHWVHGSCWDTIDCLFDCRSQPTCSSRASLSELWPIKVLMMPENIGSFRRQDWSRPQPLYIGRIFCGSCLSPRSWRKGPIPLRSL